MKKGTTNAIFLLALILTITATSFVYAGETLSGYVVTNKGQTIVIPSFSFKAEDTIEFKHKGQKIKIQWRDIKKILSVGGCDVVLTKRSGKVFEVKTANSYCGNPFGWDPSYSMRYKYFDEINETYTEGKIRYGSIKEVVFDEKLGSLMKCPKCTKTFPPDYIFCPYDKEKLELVQIK